MFGYLRLALALLVVLSHVGIGLGGKNLGVFAVVIFYILAGLVTSKIFIVFAPEQDKIRYFIKDRFLRIYPAYFLALLLTIIFFSLTLYLEPHFGLKNLILNALIVPLNYFYWIDVSMFKAPTGLNFLIPQGWSLGAELQAYALLVLAIYFKRTGLFLALVSLGIFILANSGFLNGDVYGYRLVLGVFFIFYSGFAIYEKRYDELVIMVMGVSVLLFYSAVNGDFGYFSLETSVGYILGVLLVALHEKYKPKIKFNELMGSLSYSVFISHFLFIWISEYFFGSVYLLFVLLGSLCFGLINYFIVEKVVNNIRFGEKFHFPSSNFMVSNKIKAKIQAFFAIIRPR